MKKNVARPEGIQISSCSSHVTRRGFLKATAASSAAFSTFAISGTKASGRIVGANETLRIAVAGINGRGRDHINGFSRSKDVQITYLVDPDSRLFDSRSKQVQERNGHTPECVQDIREALDDPNLDVISIATCNHWHSLMTIWACQAGKDVYVEKPISHNVFEGRQCVVATRKYNRVVQHGTQQRSNAGRAREIAALQSGKYGKLLVSKAYASKPRWSIGTKPTKSVPTGLDYNLWLGPADETPYHENLVHYNWHWFWNTGNGEIGNQGVHQADVARWAIKGATLPTKVVSLGGRFGYDDQAETPNTQLTVYDYGDVLAVFEVRGLVGKKGNLDTGYKDEIRNEFYTTEGRIADGKFYPNGGGKGERLEELGGSVYPGGEYGSFLNAVRKQDPDMVNANVEDAHYSAALCHLGNISYRLGSTTAMAGIRSPYPNNPQVNASLDKIRENLGRINLNVDQAQCQIGQVLEFDPATEKFVNNPAANALLTREYRGEFTVPKEI
ncbi:MAG: Gfo/Idh/MocA family oxidoreductase [Pirellulales bacterium]|nr:Gfo/Idh/MocA family oxidoreductase [Pirellulales bacterium]